MPTDTTNAHFRGVAFASCPVAGRTSKSGQASEYIRRGLASVAEINMPARLNVIGVVKGVVFDTHNCMDGLTAPEYFLDGQ